MSVFHRLRRFQMIDVGRGSVQISGGGLTQVTHLHQKSSPLSSTPSSSSSASVIGLAPTSFNFTTSTPTSIFCDVPFNSGDFVGQLTPMTPSNLFPGRRCQLYGQSNNIDESELNELMSTRNYCKDENIDIGYTVSNLTASYGISFIQLSLTYI